MFVMCELRKGAATQLNADTSTVTKRVVAVLNPVVQVKTRLTTTSVRFL